MRVNSLGRKALVLSGILVVSLVVVLFSSVPSAVASPRLFEDGFETGDFSKWTTGMGKRSVTSGDAHHGGYKAVLNESEEYEQTWFAPVDHVFMRAYVMFKSFPPVGLDTPILGLYNRSNPHFYMAEARVGNFAGTMKWRLRYYNSGVSYSATSEQQKPVLDTWYCIEVEAKSNSTADAESRIYINGKELTDVARTGINNTRTINCAYIWESVTGGVTQWYDCVVVDTGYVGPECVLTAGTIGSGSVVKSPDQSFYDWGTDVTLTATAAAGWGFDHWILNGVNNGSVNPYTFNVTGDYEVTAVFLRVPYSLTVSVVGHGVTNITGTHAFEEFTNVTVLATADPGSLFDHWLLDAVEAGSVNPYTINMTNNFSLTAVFTPIQYTLGYSTVGAGSVDLNQSWPYYYGDHVLLTALPNIGWSFDHWEGDLAGSDNPAVLTITGDMAVTAVFTEDQYNYLVVRGDDDRIYYRVYNSGDTSWGDWNALPEGSTLDSPAAAMYSGKLYFVVRGMDGYSLWYSWINLTDYSFSGWTWLSGATESQPTLIVYDTQLVLVVRGLDNSIYYRFYDCIADTWGDWTMVPTGATPDAPAAAVLGDGLHLVVRGMDDYSLWHSWINLTDYSFSGWTGLSGATSSRPALTTSQSLSKLHLVVRGLDDGIYSMDYDESGDSWGSWSGIPGATCDGPSVCVLNPVLNIVVRGIDGNMLWYWDGSSWTWISGSTPSAPTLTS